MTDELGRVHPVCKLCEGIVTRSLTLRVSKAPFGESLPWKPAEGRASTRMTERHSSGPLAGGVKGFCSASGSGDGGDRAVWGGRDHLLAALSVQGPGIYCVFIWRGIVGLYDTAPELE